MRIKKPQIPDRLDPSSLSLADVAGGLLSEVVAEDVATEGFVGERLLFDRARLTKVGLAAAELKDARFVDVVLTTCDLSNATFPEGVFQRVEAVECRMTGFQAGQ